MTSSILPNSPHRLLVALAVSAAANFGLWFSLSQLSSRVVPFRPPAVLEFSRVTMDEKHVIRPKVIQPTEVKKRIEKVKPPEPVRKPPPEPVRKAPPPPAQGAHNRVLLAPKQAPAPSDHPFTAPTGGDATPGAPITQQTGDNKVNTTNPPPEAPTTQPPTQPVKQDSPPVTAPQKTPVTAPVEAPPPPAPKPKGPTQDAEPNHTEDVEIPDNLKDQTFKSHVHVKVNVSADGTFDVVLRTTSGNPDIDKLVLDCLKKWKWKPALKDGEPVDSSHLFNFEFEVK